MSGTSPKRVRGACVSWNLRENAERKIMIRNRGNAFEKGLDESAEEIYVLRLYVRGATPISIRAVENIQRICEEHLRGRYDLEVIDIYQQPSLLKEEQIIAVPTLIKKLPLPLRRFIGDLSNTEKILKGLDLQRMKDRRIHMPKQTKEELLLEIEDLRIRADEAEETLRAIRKGDVDALVMSGPEGEQVFTLRGAEHPYRVFVEKMNEGALTLTSTGIISFCNARFSTIIQMPQERIVGSSIYDWVPQENRDLCREVFETGREGGAKGEFCLVTGSGRLVPVQISTSPLHLGSVTVVCAVVMDITERKATEEKIRSYMDTLEKRNEELQNFAFIASHDLQEPLRKIQVFGDLLAQKSMVFADDQSSDYIDRMRQAATRMRVLLDSLLEYSRVTTKGKSFQRFPLSEAVHEAMSNLEIRIKETKTSIALEDLPVITGDRLQMTMLFQNLIGNAVKFQSPDKEPHVRIYSGLSKTVGPIAGSRSMWRITEPVLMKDTPTAFFNPSRGLWGGPNTRAWAWGLQFVRRSWSAMAAAFRQKAPRARVRLSPSSSP
jgi:PAS domain S-box-containing protein